MKFSNLWAVFNGLLMSVGEQKQFVYYSYSGKMILRINKLICFYYDWSLPKSWREEQNASQAKGPFMYYITWMFSSACDSCMFNINPYSNPYSNPYWKGNICARSLTTNLHDALLFLSPFLSFCLFCANFSLTFISAFIYSLPLLSYV